MTVYKEISADKVEDIIHNIHVKKHGGKKMTKKKQARFVAKENNMGGPGYNVVDTKTDKDVCWVYDQNQALGYNKFSELDLKRAQIITEVLNETETVSI